MPIVALPRPTILVSLSFILNATFLTKCSISCFKLGHHTNLRAKAFIRDSLWRLVWRSLSISFDVQVVYSLSTTTIICSDRSKAKRLCHSVFILDVGGPSILVISKTLEGIGSDLAAIIISEGLGLNNINFHLNYQLSSLTRSSRGTICIVGFLHPFCTLDLIDRQLE